MISLIVFRFVFELGFHYTTQSGLKLEILLLQPPKIWDYRHAPLYKAQTLVFKQGSTVIA